MSLLDRISYEYEFQDPLVHGPNEWTPFPLVEGDSISDEDVDWLKRWAQGKTGQKYRVRYRAVLRSDWEPYTGDN